MNIKLLIKYIEDEFSIVNINNIINNNNINNKLIKILTN